MARRNVDDGEGESGHILLGLPFTPLRCTLCGGVEEIPSVIVKMFVEQIRQQSGQLVDLVGHHGRFGGYICVPCAMALGQTGLDGD